jgi:hypothetical protein
MQLWLAAPTHLQEADDGVCTLQLLLHLHPVSLQLSDACCELVNAALAAAVAAAAAAAAEGIQGTAGGISMGSR